MIFKTGVVVYNLHPRVEAALQDRGLLDDIFLTLAHRHCVVTSVREGKHAPNSYHWYGRAVDLRTNDMPPQYSYEAERRLQEGLGDGWRVELENLGRWNEHIHMEYRGE